MSAHPHEPRRCGPSIGWTHDGRIRFRWPDGSQQVLGILPAARFHERLGRLIWDAPLTIEPADRRGADHGR
jgi:hypothetical protein